MVNPFLFVLGRLNNVICDGISIERMEHNSLDAPSCSLFQQRSLLEEVPFCPAITLKAILQFILASALCRNFTCYTQLYSTHTV